VGDLSEPNWRRDLASDYEVVVAVNVVHWLSLVEAAKLFGDIFRSLRQVTFFCLWNRQERSRRSRPVSTCVIRSISIDENHVQSNRKMLVRSKILTVALTKNIPV
jgi:hypothetical protein